MAQVRHLFWLWPLVLALLAAPAHAQAQTNAGKVALVIGNAAYPDARAPLPHAINDANAMADQLRRMGFDVDFKKNLNRNELRQAVAALADKIEKGTTAVIYFSGFGLQVQRQNYLLPVDAQIWTEADVRRDGTSIDALLAQMHRKGAKVKIAIIDAARRNPFERRFRAVAEGLAPTNAPVDTLVLYSGALNRVIDEHSAGGNSMFAAELLKEMRAREATVEEVFNRVRIGVSRASGGDQVPWVASSLLGEIRFSGKVVVAPPSGRDDAKDAPAPVASVPPSEPPPAAAAPAKPAEPPPPASTPEPPRQNLASLSAPPIVPTRLTLDVTVGEMPGEKRGMLGVRVAGLSEDLAKAFGLESARGAFVSSVMPNSPALRAGIAATDVLVGFDGRNITGWNDLPIVVGGTPPGSNARATLWRLADSPKDLADKLKRRAEGDDIDASYALAWLNISETGLLKDDAEAARWARRASAAGHAEATYLLGHLYLNGHGVTKDETQAADLFRMAAGKDSLNAMHALGGLYIAGRGVSKDPAEALRWYHKAAEGGQVLSMSTLGELYLNGNAVAKDDSKAVIWFRKAADQNNPSAIANLGWMYESGQGVSKDYAQAARWYRRAADMHQSGAMYRLGAMAETGHGQNKNDAEAANWYRKAVRLEHAYAMVALGVLYQTGRGVPRDPAEALRLFIKAGEKGVAAGDFYAGLHYERAQQWEKSVSYYANAARKGDPAAMHNLGVAFDKGRGTDQNRRLAAEWILKAIKAGSAFSVKQMIDNSGAYSHEFRRQLQRQMAEAGVYDGKVDGRFGEGTRSAVEALARRANAH